MGRESSRKPTNMCDQVHESFNEQIATVKGLVSIDRSKVAALISTTPRPKPKSSTSDFVLDLVLVDNVVYH